MLSEMTYLAGLKNYHSAKSDQVNDENLNSQNAPEDTANMTDHERICVITKEIKDADRRLRSRYRIFKYQDALGLVSFLAMATITVVSSILYVQGVIPWWLCIIGNAICLSIIREIEHDLIHNLYFRTKPFVQNLLMLAVWPFLGNLPHPWYRRKMHLLHHRTSGHEEDFEERLIGNGMPFGPLKILAMLEPGLASLFRQRELRRIPFYSGAEFFRALVPVGIFYLVATYGLLLGHAVLLIGRMGGIELPAELSFAVTILDILAIVFVFPNMLRQVCVQIISSSMHYYGDVETRLQETQVMNAWWMFPLQLFTFNFGSTHSIHHFVVNQPFYLRQLVAQEAHAAFQKYGVRYNDTASVLRGNRYAK